MAKSTATPVATDPIVQAMLANTNRASIGERIMSGTAEVLAESTLVVGRLYEAVDTDRFGDGTKTQRFLNLKSRSDYWKRFGAEHGLSENDVAAIIAS